MILKDVPIRQGIAFLEPSNVELKGYMTEELEENRDADFARSLRTRLG
jgi:RecQ-mediated genome instability protein 1